MVNPEKLDRAINGTVSSKGAMTGGVGENAKPEAILAEYDRLGGLIKMGKYKVKNGSFYDFKGKAVIAKPKPMLEFNIGGELIEVAADKPLPIEVQANEMAEERKAEKAAAKKGKKGAAKKTAKKGKGGKKSNDPLDREDEELEEDTEEDEDEDGDGELA